MNTIAVLLSALLLLSTIGVGPVVSGEAGGPVAQAAPDAGDVAVRDLLSMIRDTAAIMKKLEHSIPGPDRERLARMIKRLDGLKVTEGASWRGDYVMEMAGMLKATMGILKGVVHAATVEEKRKLSEMTARLTAMRIEHGALVRKEGKLSDAREMILRDAMETLSDMVDVILRMSHTLPTRQELKRIDGIEKRLDGVLLRMDRLKPRP